MNGKRAKSVTLETARWKLASIWFPGVGIIYVLMVLQSMGGIYGQDIGKAWAWCLPNTIPTLGLMLSVFTAYALISRSMEDTMTVRLPFYRLTMYISIFYIANVFVVIVAAPYSALQSANDSADLVGALQQANFWLGPLQGLAAASLAALFFTKADEAESQTTPNGRDK